LIDPDPAAERGAAADAPFFLRHSGDLRLSWSQPEGGLTFRSAQLGALFALAGHLQTSDEPAQAIVPTGVGKTAVICALPFLARTERVLVVVPTRLLRDQIADELSSFSMLERLGAVQFDERPKVARVDHRLGTEESWEALRAADIAVGTPAVLSSEHAGVAEPPPGLFDLLLFDEAHHLPATTWSAMLKQHHRRAALVTATPFRRDRKLLPGAIVYHYGLRQAMEDGVYEPVVFKGVDAAADDDEAVAQEAVDRINSPEHVADSSLLLVRSDRIGHARVLADLYGQLGLELGVITSGQSLRHARGVIEKLRRGELRGVVSVGALVEGFDMPRLKVAAYHRPHRSLPATLQFVGRIARVTGGDAPAELVAARTDYLTHETSELYQEDALAWSELLPALADAAVQREKDVRDYVREADVRFAGEQDISAGALRPRRFTQIFDTLGCGAIDLAAELHLVGLGRLVFDFRDPASRLRALVFERLRHPEWMATRVLDSAEYQLILVVHNEPANLLFMTGPSVAMLKQIRAGIGADDALRLAPEQIARYLESENPENYSSVGMRAARAPGARLASYRMLAGSAVQGAISDSEARSHAVGHVIGRRSVGGKTHGMGASLKGAKIWETEGCDSLLEFREWCDELAAVLSAGGAQPARIPHLEQLALQELLTTFPATEIAAVLDHRLLQGGFELLVGDGGHDLTQLDLIPSRLSDHELRLELQIEAQTLWTGQLNIRGEVTAEGDDLQIRLPNGDELTVSEALNNYEPYIYFADGSSTQGSYVFRLSEALPTPASDLFEVWTWDGCDITKETGQPEVGLRNVQDHTIEWAKGHFNDPLVIVDHNSGEIADVVVVERLTQAPQERVRVHLMHCKAATQPQPTARVDDLYEVIGQTIRSARWTRPHALFRELDRRWRERPSITVETNETRDEVTAIFAAWAQQPVEVDLYVWTIQPGVSRGQMDGWANGNTLIAAASGWCTPEGATFRLAVSA
jgi:superfamily II DNA or RNA helicase